MIRRKRENTTKASDCVASAIRILRSTSTIPRSFECETFRQLQNVYRKIKSFEGSENRWKLLILLVRPAGFEPATLCLEGRCSIQLSYGRASKCETQYNRILCQYTIHNL